MIRYDTIDLNWSRSVHQPVSKPVNRRLRIDVHVQFECDVDVVTRAAHRSHLAPPPVGQSFAVLGAVIAAQSDGHTRELNDVHDQRRC